jgi:hypothetical protein
MHLLSTYLQSLLAAIYAIGTTALLGHEAAASPTTPTETGAQNKVGSIEITLPLAIAGVSPTSGHALMMPIGLWLSQHTEEEIGELLPLGLLPLAARQRLHKVIAERSQTVQGLVAQDGIAVDQVWLDFAQSVLAVAWDAYQLFPKKDKAQAIEAMHTAADGVPNFEQLTECLVGRLRIGYGLAKCKPMLPEIQVIVETQKLAAIPAHALTYIKLLITGDQIAVQGLDIALKPS